jgi:hypothetical protein
MSDKDEQPVGHFGHKSHVKHVFIKNPPPKRMFLESGTSVATENQKRTRHIPFFSGE